MCAVEREGVRGECERACVCGGAAGNVCLSCWYSITKRVSVQLAPQYDEVHIFTLYARTLMASLTFADCGSGVIELFKAIAPEREV